MVLFGRLRQEDHKFEATGATQSQSSKNKNKKWGAVEHHSRQLQVPVLTDQTGRIK